jgi:acetolactate synthase I/II/III large subunit
MEEEITGVEAVARVLKEEGVPQVFGIHGSHIWAMLSKICESGIKMIHMRHEQSGVYAADGWARCARKPGVCFGTASPGLYNMTTGLAHAFHSRSPVVAIAGQHPTTQDGWGSWQETYGAEVCQPFTKWSKRVLHTNQISFWMQKAFRDAQAYPPGPVLVEIPSNILGRLESSTKASQAGYMPLGQSAGPKPAQGDPAEVERAVRMLLEAKRPMVVAGNGVYWSDGAEELRTFVELARIPVHTRRIGRGAVREDHPLAITGGYRRPFFRDCDVMLVIGHQLNSLENFGQPPTYGTQTQYIQVGEADVEFSPMLPCKLSIRGNPKLVLKQMIDCVQSLRQAAPERPEWLAAVGKAREAHRKQQREEAAALRQAKPLHPRFMAQEIVDFLDDSATVIYDSFTMVAFITDRLEAKFAGQVLDASTFGGVGHSIGMGIGAQLARPGKQVISIIGDAGIGVAGFDIETAARYKIPAVFFVFNNSGWMSTNYQKIIAPTMDSWGMLPDIRYDKIFAEMGCHTELVTEPEQIRPALERAFNSGKPAVINAIPDATVMAPLHEANIKKIRGSK